MKSFVTILLFAFVTIYAPIKRNQIDASTSFGYDVSGYYLYLPAIFIYHDLSKLSFIENITKQYHLNGGNVTYGLYKQPNGRVLDKYAIGTAIFELPFFLLAHAYCCITGAYATDGYTFLYIWSVILATVFWVTLGLFVLRKFLQAYFRENTIFITIACIAFGTNVYFYTAIIQGMSHTFSFFLFSCLLLQTDKWYKQHKPINALLLGLTLGMIIITRPVNIVVAFIPLLWNTYDLKSIKERFAELGRNFKSLAIAIIAIVLVTFIQMAYWKYITGHWIHYSYEEEHFYFSDPYIYSGLFSYRKGWFIYTPVAFIGILGFGALWIKDKAKVLSLAIFYIIIFYIIFSWQAWFYGGSYGCRPLIETLPVLSIPLASLIELIFSRRNGWPKLAALIIFSLFIYVNIEQSYQMITGDLKWDQTDRTAYWESIKKVFSQ